MSRWKLSFVIHVGVWVCLFLLALTSKEIAQFPVGVMFALAGISYELLASITGATDPFASKPGGTGIPLLAWSIYQLALLGLLFVWFLLSISRWRKGKPGPILLLGHFLLLVGGLFGVLLVGSINFPFQL